ncbi:UDP-N-acetyl glucosamine 2-epimerase [Hypericibacter adhaerens]|uniref:UDP-N-acetyl glucosamine 2-epimerase n=1 Tax=Hypericibacter adhaerens TaxID=2602016 RepID=A0A5J6MWB4_9PROT|nr:UDP-N-acetylglucosamine 2-epimerase (non-hydrolyzing) [Hypericibacter adhaerens]QEX21444.1 UDP-N-acetyl glucosamine 2-epimerase [Hypericibacter adhaerens]
MKIVTILGTRPEIIRLSLIIPRLDRLCDHRLVHTGQNFDPRLSDIFFSELGVRSPDHRLGIESSSFGRQAGLILERVETLLAQERPDRLLVLGDTNSALSAIVAKRMGIPVFHMEAGNRCHDDRVPEEVNRRLIDQVSDVLMPYTERSRRNLAREGVPEERIYVTGNPIFEVLQHFEPAIAASTALDRMDLSPGKFLLATLHRAENTDEPVRLARLMEGLERIAATTGFPVILSAHPRLRSRLEGGGIAPGAGIRPCEPFGFFDFVALEKAAHCVLTDSGTVQEECAILGLRNVTLRDTTERPETLESGSNILAGSEPGDMLRAVQAALDGPVDGSAPAEYRRPNVSQTVTRIVTGYLRPSWGRA